MHVTRNTIVLSILLIFSIGLLGCINSGNNNPPGGNGTDNPHLFTVGDWVYYSPVQANTNPWQLIDNGNTPNEQSQLIEWLSQEMITYSHAAFIPHDEITCEALNCPRGDWVVIKPLTQESGEKLLSRGFRLVQEPLFILEKGIDTSVQPLLVNGGNTPIYFGGCNDYLLQKKQGTDWVDQPQHVCVWEGIPTILPAGEERALVGETLSGGTYRALLSYGVSCSTDTPLSQANCETTHVITSNLVMPTGVASEPYAVVEYAVKQCNENPWVTAGTPAETSSTQEQEAAIVTWLSQNGLSPHELSIVPPADDVSYCDACSCPTGETVRATIPYEFVPVAEKLGFTFSKWDVPVSTAPDYTLVDWFVYIPRQCYISKWNNKTNPIRSLEQDYTAMIGWLESQEIKIDYTTYIPGSTFGIDCSKLSNTKYGVGTLNHELEKILPGLGFAKAGKSQVTLFTSTEEGSGIDLLYKTKFCVPAPWGEPDLILGNEKDTSYRVAEWLGEQGISLTSAPQVYPVAKSSTGVCGTDSGLSVKITVPDWAETHLGPTGFLQYSLNVGSGTEILFPPAMDVEEV